MASRTSKTLSKNERSYYYKAIKQLDPNDQYVICDEDSDTLCYSSLIEAPKLTGRPNDEELTRALIVVNLSNLPIPSVLLSSGNRCETIFAEYEESSQRILRKIASYEEELDRLKEETAEEIIKQLTIEYS